MQHNIFSKWIHPCSHHQVKKKNILNTPEVFTFVSTANYHSFFSLLSQSINFAYFWIYSILVSGFYYSILCLRNNPYCWYSSSGSLSLQYSIPLPQFVYLFLLLKGIWVISSLEILQAALPWTFWYLSFGSHLTYIPPKNGVVGSSDMHIFHLSRYCGFQRVVSIYLPFSSGQDTVAHPCSTGHCLHF